MKLFKFHIGRKKEINWMTVKCDVCKCSCGNQNCEKPYVMYVDRDEIKIRPTGYKGRIQLYTHCTKCGKSVIIPETSVPKNIWNYILEKAYVSDNCFEF